MSEHAYECQECDARLVSEKPTEGDLACPFCEDQIMRLVTALARKPRPRAGRHDEETGITVVGDVVSAVRHLFRGAQNVDGSELVDEETGIVVARSEGMTFAINEFLGDPPVESVELGDDGQVKNMKVKPHEWPPRGEGF